MIPPLAGPPLRKEEWLGEVRRLIQLIPSHHRHDAAGAEVVTIERILRAASWRVDTYADNIDSELEGRTLPAEQLDEADTDGAVALYHFCAASPMTFRFAELDCPKVLLYHNITPHEFFEPFNMEVANVCREGREQLRMLVDAVEVAIGDSDFNRLELEVMGFDVTRTIRYLYDPSRLEIEPDKGMLERLQGPPVVLFTGRFAPNKAPEDFIRTAAAYGELEDAPTARFVLVGKRRTIKGYYETVEKLIEELALPRDRLLITDEVSEAELVAAYKSASLFLSLSRHEGFCVPLVEAMQFGIPILALARAAVPETLGDAGLLFDATKPEEVAEMVAGVLSDETLWKEMQQRGRRRLRLFDLEHWGFVFRVLLESL
jgi:glycosyltransferase involved in cell wall biosynthesis